MSDQPYFPENEDEINRLEGKTEKQAVIDQARWAGLQPGMRILDVGCGPGITTAFLAEAAQPGSGPRAALETVRGNFGVSVRYFARIRFDGVQDIVDSMGGVTVNLPAPMSGYDAGPHTLNGEQALAFARDRQGSDDFFRMQRGQLLIQSAIVKMVNPLNWGYLPGTVAATMRSVDTNLPLWEMPRMGLALVRATLTDTLNARTISREMVTPFTTNQGANVLLPNWGAINPLLQEMFGE